MASPAVHSCDNAECTVRVNGICVENNRLEDCPYYGANQSTEPPDAVEGEVDTVATDDLEEIEDAVRLLSSDAATHLGEFETSVVAIVGPSAAGKTCMLAGLYDLFLMGPVGAFHFAGSKTLHAFDEVGHGARLESGSSEPNSERTHSGPAKFFELTLGIEGERRKRRLLLADRWGEDYTFDVHPRPEEFFEISRADVLTMLLDGERLLDPKSRFEVTDEVMSTLRVFSEVGLLRRKPHLAVVLTKLDLVNGSANKRRAMEDFTRLVGKVEDQFSGQVCAVSPYCTSASPKLMLTKRGEGLAELLACWVTGRATDRYVRKRYAPRRQIDAFPRPEEA